MPNDEMGMMGEIAVEMKAMAVVKDVLNTLSKGKKSKHSHSSFTSSELSLVAKHNRIEKNRRLMMRFLLTACIVRL